MSQKVSVDALADAVMQQLDEYNELATDEMKKAVKKAGKTVKEEINASAPDLLIVCLGSPRQELWMKRNADRLLVGMMIGLGGTLDVYAGRVERAPEGWRRLGLEWLYRAITEPRRLRRVWRLPAILFIALYRRIIK